MMVAELVVGSGEQPSTKMAPEGRLVIGRVGAPHGVRGWMKVHSFTEPFDQLLDYSPLWIQRGGQWQKLELAEYRIQDAVLVVRAEGVEDRDGAALLRNCDIGIADSQLAELEPGEYYWRELIGLEVVSHFEGQDYQLGTVSGLLETGANDVLVVQAGTDSFDCRQRLIPYEHQFLLKVDLEAGRVDVNWDPHF